MLSTYLNKILSPSVLKSHFNESTLLRAKEYQQKGYVTKVCFLKDPKNNEVIHSQVLGKGEPFYDVAIEVFEGPSELIIQGKCTCWVNYNCKHAAATLLHLCFKPEIKATPPSTFIPHLSLFGDTFLVKDINRPYDEPKKAVVALARLSFKYGNHSVRANTSSHTIDFVRDKAQELNIILQLQEKGLFAFTSRGEKNYPDKENIYFVGDPLIPRAQLDFIHKHLPQLEKENWIIERADTFPLELIEEQEWYTELEEKSSYDWFGFSLGIIYNDEKINILPVIIDFIKKNPRNMHQASLETFPNDHVFYLPLPDGRYISIAAKRIKAILSTLIELYDKDSLHEGKVQITRLQAGQLLALQETLDARWLGGEKLKALGEKLRDFKKIEVQAIPKSFSGTLRPYQKEGFYWLRFLKDLGMGGILADDMGLGKTVQILTLLLSCKAQRKQLGASLIIAPTSLMDNWRRETERFTPSLKLLILQGDKRQDDFNQIENVDIVVSTYPLLIRDKEFLTNQNFNYLILDEAQFIKNAKTKSYEVLLQVKAKQTICVTGTPIENHLGELWSLFNLAVPGLLGNDLKFKQYFRHPIEKDNNIERQKNLNLRVSPFILRRKKEEVATELPPKTEVIHRIEIEGAQRDLYESVRLAMDAKVRKAIMSKGLSRSHIVVLDALLKLRQICNDPRLLPFKINHQAKKSAKLEFLMEMIATLMEENKKVLIFSSFTSMLALIESELTDKGFDCVKLTGQTKDRITPVQRFQTNQVPIMLVSLKAGGTGLNLTAADTVIHYDPWWNPAAENQATDRAHRIGQDKSVFVYKLVCQGTVEERIIEMQHRKNKLIDNLFKAQEKRSGKLTKEDLAILFEPLG